MGLQPGARRDHGAGNSHPKVADQYNGLEKSCFERVPDVHELVQERKVPTSTCAGFENSEDLASLHRRTIPLLLNVILFKTTQPPSKHDRKVSGSAGVTTKEDRSGVSPRRPRSRLFGLLRAG